MSEWEREGEVLDLLRSLLLRAGLERDEEELEWLLPRWRDHLESEACISELPLEDTEPQVVFDPRWPT